MFESKAGVLFIAGLGFFALAFLSNVVVPVLMFQDLPEQSAEAMVNDRVLYQFNETKYRWPEQFAKYYDTAPIEKEFAGYDKDRDGLVALEDLPEQRKPLFDVADLNDDGQLDVEEQARAASMVRCVEAMRLGRQIYIGEGCWHCHSQFVRPVSNESRRYGDVSETWEYQNELQRPVMFGTRRVGPDLSRQGGRHGNDWHAAHFFKPKSVVSDSPMPEYPWLFDGDPGLPNKRGLALITYMQWLGSWLDSYPYYEELQSITSEGY